MYTRVINLQINNILSALKIKRIIFQRVKNNLKFIYQITTSI